MISKQTQTGKGNTMAKSFLQKMVEDGSYEGSIEILVGAINDKEVTSTLDEIFEFGNKLTKKISIPDCKKLIKAGP